MAKRTTRKSQTEGQPEDAPEKDETTAAASEVDNAPAESDETAAGETPPQSDAAPSADRVTSEEPEAPSGQAPETTAAEAETTAEPSEETAAVPAGESAAAEEQARSETETGPAPAPPPPVIVKRGGFVPVVLGGVVAAAIGAGAVIYALPHLPPQLSGLLPQPPQQTDLQAALDAKLAAQTKKIDALGEELASLKSATPPAPDLSGVKSVLDQITADVEANKSAIADLGQQIKALPQQGDGSSQAQIEAAAKAAEDRIKQAEAQAEQLKAQSEAAAKAAMVQAAAARAKAALEMGAPLGPALADLSAAGASVPAALSAEIPSLQSLQQSFPDAARAALAAARRTKAGTTLSDRIGAFLLAQTGARSVAPREGNSPDAILSRAQADVDAGRLGAALDEISKLPDVAQAPLSDWVAKAKTRLAAIDAVTQLGATQ